MATDPDSEFVCSPPPKPYYRFSREYLMTPDGLAQVSACVEKIERHYQKWSEGTPLPDTITCIGDVEQLRLGYENYGHLPHIESAHEDYSFVPVKISSRSFLFWNTVEEGVKLVRSDN